jgi:hypothetical protein
MKSIRGRDVKEISLRVIEEEKGGRSQRLENEREMGDGSSGSDDNSDSDISVGNDKRGN